jgi:hypothetical protein
VACRHQVATGLRQHRADELARGLPRTAWERPAGQGAKGHRSSDWASISIGPGRPGHHWLLVRRRSTRDLACHRCYAPPPPLATPVKVAGTRWSAEENFQAGKGRAGLDEHQVRARTSWRRRVTLAMLGCAFPAIAAAGHSRPPQHQQPFSAGRR